MPIFCSVEGCDRTYYAKGYCRLHYDRVRANGDPLNTRVRHTKHPLSGTPTYTSWCLMKNRCYCKTAASYPYYGGRGIKVCDRWQGKYGFDNFVLDMGERPKGYTLDRIDPDGDYCPENCRWADIYTQTANRNIQKKGGSVTGVFYREDRGSWVASLVVKQVEYRKYFRTEQEAIKYRLHLERKYLVKDK